MSKRGDGYVRSMMIEGAQAVLSRLDPRSAQPDDRRLLRWMERHGRKGAAIRLANRNLRIVWVMLQNDRSYCRDGGAPSPSAHSAQVPGVQHTDVGH
jgi:hypothetical protein